MNIAKEVGSYNNFSGRIRHEKINCVVERANFDLKSKELAGNSEIIVFYDGILKSGKIERGYIENGINIGCRLNLCNIAYIIQKKGTLDRCKWHDGVFDSTSSDNVWITGYDRYGYERDTAPDLWDKKVAVSAGEYKNFTGYIIVGQNRCYVENSSFKLMAAGSLHFYDCILKSGEIEYALIDNGLNRGALINECTIKYIINLSGTISNSTIDGCLWRGGVFGKGNTDSSGVSISIPPQS